MKTITQTREPLLMKPLGIALAVLLLVVSGTSGDEPKGDSKAAASKSEKPQASSTEKKTKIVLVGTTLDHPYATHMYLHECRLLANCLEQTPGVEAVVVQDWPDDKTLEEARAMVFYSRPAGDIVLNAKHRDAFRKRMAAGMGFVAIHWGTAANKKSLGEEYLKVLGGWHHPEHASQAVETQELQQVDDKHPICRGWKNYKLHEEFYFKLKYHPQMKPLVQVTMKNPAVANTPQVVAWTLERPESGNGRSFGTTLGHFHENFGITSFRKLVVNGILWSAHVEIPADGAPVSVTTDDLELPPPVIPAKK